MGITIGGVEAMELEGKVDVAAFKVTVYSTSEACIKQQDVVYSTELIMTGTD